MMQPVSVPVSATPARLSIALLAGIAAIAALSVIWLVFSYGYLEDDAFIHLVFARSVAEGKGFAFNDIPVNGDTAPLWALILTLFHGLGLDWVVGAKLACGPGVLMVIGAIVRLMSDLPVPAENRGSLTAAALAVTLLNPYFVRWSFSGMEAVTAVGVGLWIVWAVFVRQPSWGKLLLGAILIGFGPLLRPELLLLAVLAGPVLLWKAWRLGCHGARMRSLACVAGLAVLMVLPLALWMIYALHAFGSIIPNTNAAKRGGSLLELGPRLISVYLAGFAVTLALLPLLALRALKLRDAPVAIWMLLGWPVACIAFYLADHTLVQTRYCLLSMPCMSLAVLWVLSTSGRNSWFRAATIAMVAVAVLETVLSVVPLVANKVQATRAFAALSTYIREQVPRGAPVAVYAIGQVAFQGAHPIIDLGGITQPGVIPYMNDPKAAVRWAKAQGARYLVGHGGEPEVGAPRLFQTSTPYLGWSFGTSKQQTNDPLVLYALRP